MTRIVIAFCLLAACPETQYQQIDELNDRIKGLERQEVIMVSRLDMIAIALDNCRRDR